MLLINLLLKYFVIYNVKLLAAAGARVKECVEGKVLKWKKTGVVRVQNGEVTKYWKEEMQ